MIQGYGYLQNVVAYYRRQIKARRIDEVIADIGLDLWKMDDSLERIPAETVHVAEDLLERVHGCVLRGAYPEALEFLDRLEAQLAEFESKGHRRPA